MGSTQGSSGHNSMGREALWTDQCPSEFSESQRYFFQTLAGVTACHLFSTHIRVGKAVFIRMYYFSSSWPQPQEGLRSDTDIFVSKIREPKFRVSEGFSPDHSAESGIEFMTSHQILEGWPCAGASQKG